MKTTLTDLMKRISPLPWNQQGSFVASSNEDVAQCHADNEQGLDLYPHAAYLTHAANTLPGLVEALKLMRRNRACHCDLPYCYVCVGRKALQAAENVEV